MVEMKQYNRFQHFQIQPMKCPVQNNVIWTCLLLCLRTYTKINFVPVVCVLLQFIFLHSFWFLKKKTMHTLSQELYISEFELSFQVIGILKWHDWKFKQLFFSVLCHQIKASACKLTKAKTKDHGANKSFPWMEKSKIFWTKSSGYTFIFVSS